MHLLMENDGIRRQSTRPLLPEERRELGKKLYQNFSVPIEETKRVYLPVFCFECKAATVTSKGDICSTCAEKILNTDKFFLPIDASGPALVVFLCGVGIVVFAFCGWLIDQIK